eukprot:scaffold4229_cov30-Tisochrysis_lutea.AAC.2
MEQQAEHRQQLFGRERSLLCRPLGFCRLAAGTQQLRGSEVGARVESGAPTDSRTYQRAAEEPAQLGAPCQQPDPLEESRERALLTVNIDCAVDSGCERGGGLLRARRSPAERERGAEAS